VNVRLMPLALTLAGALVAAACTSAAATTGARTASGHPVGPAATASRIKELGVYEPGVPKSYKPVETFAHAVGRQPNIVQYYSGWWEPFRAGFARTAHSHGATVFVDIDPYGVPVAGIAAGDNDVYLNNFATAVHKFGHRVIISFGHEPNGKWYPWGYTHTKAATWVAAWRHIVTVFRAAGATNVTWLWIVNRQAAGEGAIRSWWPGGSYVTWAGIDGYYEKKGQTFPIVFNPTISAIRRLTKKPILISETAIGQTAGKAAKIPGLFRGIRAHHLLGLVWFDQHQRAGSHHQNWRLEDSRAAVTAFRRGLRG